MLEAIDAFGRWAVIEQPGPVAFTVLMVAYLSACALAGVVVWLFCKFMPYANHILVGLSLGWIGYCLWQAVEYFTGTAP